MRNRSTPIYAVVNDNLVRERIDKIRTLLEALEAELAMLNPRTPLLCWCPGPDGDIFEDDEVTVHGLGFLDDTEEIMLHALIQTIRERHSKRYV